MRLMLGTSVDGKQTPSLLVDILQEHSPTHFEFRVVNGCWEGTFTDGFITVHHPREPFSSLEKCEILTANQDRLRGEYQDVFNNFDNVNYNAPKENNFKLPEEWDDDIPF